jgi:hypothetical protein
MLGMFYSCQLGQKTDTEVKWILNFNSLTLINLIKNDIGLLDAGLPTIGSFRSQFGGMVLL